MFTGKHFQNIYFMFQRKERQNQLHCFTSQVILHNDVQRTNQCGTFFPITSPLFLCCITYWYYHYQPQTTRILQAWQERDQVKETMPDTTLSNFLWAEKESQLGDNKSCVHLFIYSIITPPRNNGCVVDNCGCLK